MTTASTSSPGFFATFLADIEAIGSYVVKKVQSWATSAQGQQTTVALARIAGVVAGDALIANVKSASPGAVANDVMAIGTAATAEISGSIPPTVVQLTDVFTALKSDESTQLYIPLAQAAATVIFGFIDTNNGGASDPNVKGQWQPIAAAFIGGMMQVAEGYGAVAPTAVKA